MAKRKAPRKAAADTAANSSLAGDLHNSHPVVAEAVDTREAGDRSGTATSSASAVRDPSEEDIRIRAYHRCYFLDALLAAGKRTGKDVAAPLDRVPAGLDAAHVGCVR